MKKILIILMVIVAFTLGTTFVIAENIIQDLSVSYNVVAINQFTISPTSLDFGNITPDGDAVSKTLTYTVKSNDDNTKKITGIIATDQQYDGVTITANFEEPGTSTLAGAKTLLDSSAVTLVSGIADHTDTSGNADSATLEISAGFAAASGAKTITITFTFTDDSSQ